MKVLAPLSSPKPYTPQAKVTSNANANNARQGGLLLNDQRFIYEKGKQVLVKPEVALNVLSQIFEPVLN